MHSPTKALLFILTLLATHAAVAADSKVALVIGNGAYRHAGALRNPPNDAKAMAEMISRMGFDSVDVAYDRDVATFRADLRKFAAKAREADVAAVYFAGHGIEVGGDNFLIPVDAVLAHEDDTRYEAISLEEVVHAVRSARKLRLVILDACRNNPFAGRMVRKSGQTRSTQGGLAAIETTGDILVAYAAKHGTTAADGSGDNSPYAEALLRHMPTPGLDIRIMFGRVRDHVLAATRAGQEPYTYGSVGGQYVYLTMSGMADLGPPAYKPDRWIKTNGPYGQAPHAFSIDPNEQSVLYAGGDRGEVHRSLDGGRTWVVLGEPAPTDDQITAVGAAGGHEYRLFAGTTGGLFVRRSDVSPWERVPYFDKLGDANVRAITGSAQHPGMLYVASGAAKITMTAGAGTGGAAGSGTENSEGRTVHHLEWKEDAGAGNVHRSYDGGRTRTSGGLPITNSIAVAPSNPSIVVLGTSDDGVIATVDGGNNWRQFKCLQRRYVSEQIAISAQYPMQALVATDRGAFLLDLAEAPNCKPLSLQEKTLSAAISPTSARHLFLGTEDGVFESLDGGDSFWVLSDGLFHSVF